jgi:hypothetical protein
MKKEMAENQRLNKHQKGVTGNNGGKPNRLNKIIENQRRLTSWHII